MSLIDLIAEVAAEHVRTEYPAGVTFCAAGCDETFPCKPARLAAAFSVENVAAGLHEACIAEWAKEPPGRLATRHLTDAHMERAAALLAALAERT